MLRQVYIVLDDAIIYERNYGKVMSKNDFLNIFSDIKSHAFKGIGNEIGDFYFYKYKVSYLGERDSNLIFVFITGLNDEKGTIKTELFKLKKEFSQYFEGNVTKGIDPALFDIISPIIDTIHRHLKPKVSLIGFAGVGKTSITKLIKA